MASYNQLLCDDPQNETSGRMGMLNVPNSKLNLPDAETPLDMSLVYRGGAPPVNNLMPQPGVSKVRTYGPMDPNTPVADQFSGVPVYKPTANMPHPGFLLGQGESPQMRQQDSKDEVSRTMGGEYRTAPGSASDPFGMGGKFPCESDEQFEETVRIRNEMIAKARTTPTTTLPDSKTQHSSCNNSHADDQEGSCGSSPKRAMLGILLVILILFVIMKKDSTTTTSFSS